MNSEVRVGMESDQIERKQKHELVSAKLTHFPSFPSVASTMEDRDRSWGGERRRVKAGRQ